MLLKIEQAQQGFEQLPSAVRARFKNDPMELVAFVGDNRNAEEAVKLGLLPRSQKSSQNNQNQNQNQNSQNTPAPAPVPARIVSRIVTGKQIGRAHV